LTAFAILAAALLGYSLLSRRLERASISGPLLLVAAGVVAGPHVLDAVHTSLAHGAGLRFAEITLVVVLFSDASRIDLRSLRADAPLPGRLLGLGMPLTIGLGVAFGVLLLGDLTVWEAAMVAAILAPTDAALGQTVVASPRVPKRVRRALTVESGLNDGLSVPFLALFVVLAVEEESSGAHHWLGYTLRLIGLGVLVGVVIGAVGGRIVERAFARRWMSSGLGAMAPLALAVLCWALAEALGGNGFIAAFVGGLCAGHMSAVCGERILDFSEEEGALLSLSVFFVFGTVAIDLAEHADLAIVAYAVLSLTVIRMLPVALALAGTGLRGSTVAFMGWFGPRGLASIILALTVAEEQPQLPGLDRVMAAMTVAVLLSIAAHGLSAGVLSKAYAARVRDLPADAPEHDVPAAAVPPDTSPVGA
jgi:NhaP-type Na+/H+ or K+/H+ antiporter